MRGGRSRVEASGDGNLSTACSRRVPTSAGQVDAVEGDRRNVVWTPRKDERHQHQHHSIASVCTICNHLEAKLLRAETVISQKRAQ
ncbi:unnamed protein product [Protopolystoma xenopodis]|uniref:Uncharacterized protein n=1 Tax=Protopolystoma xenopodis TaxID=117903 RepID=A0A3S5CSD5_9PLAT|nr:unnamed protein product [Protopolystoma xenopodis]